MSVAEFAKQNNIDLIFDTNVEEKIMAFDFEKLERIMLNLLSNSIKYNKANGKIEVLLNASNENVKVKGEGEILFARKFDGDILGANGTLIRKIGVTIQ